MTSKKIFKKWSARFFSIQRGRLLLFRSKLKAAQGSPALVAVPLHPKQTISHVTDTTNKDIEHLHMITLRENVTSSPNGSGSGNNSFSEARPSKIGKTIFFDSFFFFLCVMNCALLTQFFFIFFLLFFLSFSLSFLSFFEACELACDTIKCAEELRSKLEEIIHNMQEEMRRHR